MTRRNVESSASVIYNVIFKRAGHEHVMTLHFLLYHPTGEKDIRLAKILSKIHDQMLIQRLPYGIKSRGSALMMVIVFDWPKRPIAVIWFHRPWKSLGEVSNYGSPHRAGMSWHFGEKSLVLERADV